MFPSDIFPEVELLDRMVVLLLIFFLILLIYFWLCWISDAACKLSLAVASGDSSWAAVCGLFIVVPSLVAEHRLQGTQPSQGAPASVIAARGLQQLWFLGSGTQAQ